MTKGFGLLRGAIIATGIGALIVLIGSLIQWLTKTQRGMELVSKVTAAFGAALDVVTDRMVMVIDAFKLFFEGDFSGGFDKLGESVSGVGDEMQREVALAWQLREAMIALEKAETDFTLTQAERRKQIQELIFLTRDETVSFERRQEALRQANELERQNMEESLALQRERVRILQEDYDRAESTEEDRKALIAERVKLEELEAQSLSRQRELRNRVNELTNKQRAAEQKAYAERVKEIEAQRKAEEQLRKEQEEWNAQLEQDAIEAAAAEAQAVEDALAEIAEMRKAGYEQQLLDRELQNEELQIQAQEAYIDGLISEQEYQTALVELERARLEAQLQVEREYHGKSSAEARKAELELQKFLTDTKREEVARFKAAEDQKRKNTEAAMMGALSVSSNVFGSLASLYEEGSREYIVFAKLQAQADTLQASLAAYKSAAAIPIVGPTLAPIAAATAFAFGQLRAAQIGELKKEPARFEHGGVLDGPRHSQGGIPGVIRGSGQPIEMEGGEIILTRAVGMDPTGRAMASNLNAMYGGVRFFENGGPVDAFGSAGAVITPPEVRAQGGLGDMEVSGKLDTLISIMAAYPTRLRVVNNVQDTREGINVLNELQADADF